MTGVGPVIPEGLTIVLGAIVWIPVTVWILSLVHWAISGEIDFLSALLGVSLGFALGFLTLKPPIPIVSPILFVATWLTVILYPVVKSSMDKRALVAIDLESLDRAYQAL